MAFVAVDSGNIRNNVLIQADTLNVNAPPTLPGVDPLQSHVVYEAMHDSGEVDAQGDCHPGTRIAIQEIIKRWAEDPRPNTLVNLMIGAAGAGKSAIMRTIAKVLAKEGKLLGDFFCFRSSTRRNNGSLVIPTLAAQMVTRIPHLRPLVYKAFEDNQGLLTKAMDIQALKLVIEPLNSIDPMERPQWPYVVLLDGLDEINGIAAQQAIVRVFAYINRHLVSPLHFLVASRPEPPILQAFDEFTGDSWTRLELDESLNPNDDIDIFYIDHFQRIRNRNPHLPLGWPGVPVRRILVDKGSGKFIFASVVVGVVGDPSSALSPQERLDLVLEVTKRDDLQPLERLDLLYVTVLNQIPTAERAQVLRILAVILAAGNALRDLSPTPNFLDALFCMPSGTTRHRLCNLHSILNIRDDDNGIISPQHATLGDFVFDKARSEQFGFHVDKTQLVGSTVLQIAEALQSNPEQISNAFHYFITFFDTQTKALDRGSLPLELAQKLQSYNPSSLSPLALILLAAPLAWMMESSGKHRSFHNLSRSVIKEAHRRARLYYNDYGRPGATLLAISAMKVHCSGISKTLNSEDDDWVAASALFTELGESAMLYMDRTSGLGLTYVKFSSTSPLPLGRILARNRWLDSYLHLLTRLDIVADISRLRRLTQPQYPLGPGLTQPQYPLGPGLTQPQSPLGPRLRQLQSPLAWRLTQSQSVLVGIMGFQSTLFVRQWSESLPFDQSAISALRTTLLSARPECGDEDFNAFILKLKDYINDHWEKRWRIPSLYLLRRDWNRWKEVYDRANGASASLTTSYSNFDMFYEI